VAKKFSLFKMFVLTLIAATETEVRVTTGWLAGLLASNRAVDEETVN
jgi:hypothetical protein